MKFDGFLTLYQEGRDDEEDEDEGRLPPMTAGEPLERRRHRRHASISPSRRPASPKRASSSAWKSSASAAPPPMRPCSRCCATGNTSGSRRSASCPRTRAGIVIAFLESFFRRYVEYDFTADLEEQLDRVSNHEIDWKQVLRDFWRDFSAAIGETKELRTAEVLDALNELLGPHIFPDKGDGSNPRACPTCGAGQLSLKLGKFGAFIGCSNYPECKYTRQLAATGANGDGEGRRRTVGQPGVQGARRGSGHRPGRDPARRTLRRRSCSLGEGEKPKRSSLPKGLTPAAVDLERALKLLALPREVAKHPESGEPILVGIGPLRPLRAARQDLREHRQGR